MQPAAIDRDRKKKLYAAGGGQGRPGTAPKNL